MHAEAALNVQQQLSDHETRITVQEKLNEIRDERLQRIEHAIIAVAAALLLIFAGIICQFVFGVKVHP